ncbi:MAG: hypothetical protein KBA38_09125 [Negativicutes bacterium]|nr:hypothetical protein [Negativicutes bacterium]
MEIEKWLNREFEGSEFTIWNYDESVSIEELEELGYPYATACIEIDDETFIAVDCGDLTPFEFIQNNQNTKFILDAFKHPRRINSFLGNVKMFYAKQLSSEEFSEYQYGRFAIDIFKNGDNYFGAPRIGYSSDFMIDLFFEKLREKWNKIRVSKNTLDKIYSFEAEEVGSASFQVDFFSEEPYYLISFETLGITYNRLGEIISAIHEDIYKDD